MPFIFLRDLVVNIDGNPGSPTDLTHPLADLDQQPIVDALMMARIGISTENVTMGATVTQASPSVQAVITDPLAGGTPTVTCIVKGSGIDPELHFIEGWAWHDSATENPIAVEAKEYRIGAFAMLSDVAGLKRVSGQQLILSPPFFSDNFALSIVFPTSPSSVTPGAIYKDSPGDLFWGKGVVWEKLNFTLAEAATVGPVDSVFGRTGAVVAVSGDYTFAEIDKTLSSLADLTTRSAGALNSGTLLDARLSANVPLLAANNTFTGSTTQTSFIFRATDSLQLVDTVIKRTGAILDFEDSTSGFTYSLRSLGYIVTGNVAFLGSGIGLEMAGSGERGMAWSATASATDAKDTGLHRSAAGIVNCFGGLLTFPAVGGVGYAVNNTKIIGVQGAAVADAAAGATIDVEARAAINALLARLRTHGLIAP